MLDTCHYNHPLEGTQVVAVGKKMRPLSLGTLAAMATMGACSLFHSEQSATLKHPYPPFDHVDEAIQLPRNHPDLRWDPDQITHDDFSAGLQVVIQNNRSNAIYTYVTGVNTTSGDYLILRKGSNGTFNWAVKPSGNESTNANAYYFTESDSSYEIRAKTNHNTSFYIPSYAAAGRIYISDNTLRFGTNEGGPMAGFVAPSVSNPGLPEYSHAWQFVEYTWTQDEFLINLSNVDLVSIPIGFAVASKNESKSVYVPGLVENATALVCEALSNQTIEDGYNWKDLCIWDQNHELIRVLSPEQYLSMNATDPLNHYYDEYIERVWSYYSTTNLTINTQDSRSEDTGSNNPHHGIKTAVGQQVSCMVGNDMQLHCYNPTSGTRYAFSKPTTKEIFGCIQDGNTFQVGQNAMADWTQAEVVPRLCAAFHRSTLLRPGGDVQPYLNGSGTADEYYCKKDPTMTYCPRNTTNHYARVVHEHEQSGMGYAFAYDDTNPIADDLDNASANAAGLISDSNPASIFIIVGI